jgi:protein-tyrosine-phosphatase
MDLDAIRSKLNKLQNTQKKSDRIWKPTPGKHQVRIVPYKFDPDNPFIELYFHYNVNNKTYLSPITFGRPDPIVEFADKLKNTGDKDDWKAGKNMEPKLRTYVPVLVRGEENEGVKFWGFGKTVYQEILGYAADEDYGDISDPVTGRDLTIDYKSAEEGGTQFPTTTLRVKPNQSKILDDAATAKKLMGEQIQITDLYTELSYDEMKNVLEAWLNPEAEAEIKDSPKPIQSSTKDVETPWKEDEDNQSSAKLASAESEFDDLFSK